MSIWTRAVCGLPIRRRRCSGPRSVGPNASQPNPCRRTIWRGWSNAGCVMRDCLHACRPIPFVERRRVVGAEVEGESLIVVHALVWPDHNCPLTRRARRHDWTIITLDNAIKAFQISSDDSARQTLLVRFDYNRLPCSGLQRRARR